MTGPSGITMKSVRNEIYCPLIWQQAATTTDGYFSPCCEFMSDKKPHWSEGYDKIKNAWDYQKHQMNNGIKIKECNWCWEKEEKGQKSLRMSSLEHNPFEDDDIYRIDFKLGNMCNLGCRMCVPFASTVIQQEILKNPKEKWVKLDVDDAKVNYNKQDWFLTALDAALDFDKLRVMKFTGGEPFSIPEVKNFLKNYSNKNETDLVFVTNGLLINDEIINILKQFRHVHLSMSCDGIQDLYDYIRWPGKWINFEQKYLRFKDEFDVVVGITFNAFNIYYMPEILDYFYKHDQEINLIHVTDPIYAKPWIYPDIYKDKIKRKFAKYKHLKNRLDDIIAYETPYVEKDYLEFLNQKEIKDRLRNQKFKTFGKLNG